MLKYIVVFGIAMAIFLVFATDDIPFMERNYATSEETRAAAQAANIPKYTRQQATTFVEEDIRANCAVADEYLPHLNSFEVTWMRQPRTDDRHAQTTATKGVIGNGLLPILLPARTGDCTKTTTRLPPS